LWGYENRLKDDRGTTSRTIIWLCAMTDGDVKSGPVVDRRLPARRSAMRFCSQADRREFGF
jgi:hypothetical protein